MDNSDIRILVVDDDPDILFTTVRILKKEGFEVISADTGNQSLEKVENDHPDLILLDVELPDILGTEVCEKVKGNPDHRKKYIMMLSGVKISSNDQADGLDSGADGYIARPVSNRELVSRVNSMVRLIRAERKTDSYILELEQAMEKIKMLSGIIPICMHCKQIRDDKGYWNRIEEFIENHSEAQFSHSLCETCLEKYYPEDDD
jgi:phosphoserine phosphatase RsbU/P